MASNKTLLILPGDGIGPEVMREVRHVIDWMDKRRAVTFDVSEGKVGGAAIDASGTPLSPDAPNGYKLERFIFDALLTARRVCVVEVRREEEYSPVKNAEGPDSPATARRDLEANYRAWLSEAGLPAPPERDSLEIDESCISGPEELRALGVEGLANADEVMLTSPGAKA